MKVVRLAVIAGALAAVICGNALEAAAQQQPIVGCVKPGTGLLRIPLHNEGCKPEEIPLGFSDLPLLVALQQLVATLQEQVAMLEAQVEKLVMCTASIPACGD